MPSEVLPGFDQDLINDQDIVVVPSENEGGYALSLHNKTLTLKIMPPTEDFYARAVGEIYNQSGDNVAGTTSRLYKKAYNLMQENASDYGTISFTFRTANEKMQHWAMTSGKKIFHWQNTDHERSGSEVWLVLSTLIPPKKQAT